MHRRSRVSRRHRLLSTTITALLILGACGSDTDQPIAADSSTGSSDRLAESAESVKPISPSEDPQDEDTMDLTGVLPANGVDAASLLSLYEGPDTQPALAAGDWFASSFSEPLAFRLPEAGRLRGVGLGWIDIEIGPTPGAPRGVIRIVEAIALSSPNGPRPIASITPETEFADTEQLDKGTAFTTDAELSWRDLIIDPLFIPDNFEQPCPFDDTVQCVDPPITDSGPVFVELDTAHRWVGQDFGERRLYVVATPTSAGDAEFLDYSFEVAASIVTVPTRVETATRRPLATVGLRGDSIPAGSWFHTLGSIRAEITLTSELANTRVTSLQPTWFTLENQEDETFFSVQLFQGFIDPALVDESDRTEPLTADVFIDALARIIEITESGDEQFVGYDALRYQVGSAPEDSPHSCSADERSDLRARETCVVWSADGWRFVNHPDEDDGNYLSRYIEELGVIVETPLDGELNAVSVASPFDLLIAGLTLESLNATG